MLNQKILLKLISLRNHRPQRFGSDNFSECSSKSDADSVSDFHFFHDPEHDLTEEDVNDLIQTMLNQELLNMHST